MLRHIICSILATIFLSSCNYLPDWMGKDDEKVALPGKRIALKRQSKLFEAEITQSGNIVSLPETRQNSSWKQAMGSAASVYDHLEINQPLAMNVSANIGDNNEFDTSVIPTPVIDGERIFAIDGSGTISAHKTDTLEIIWKSDLLKNYDDSDAQIGGGLATANEIVYGVNDEGTMIAISAIDGSPIWKQDLKLPIHASPRLAGKTILIQSADNQLLALNRHDGEPRWIHQGINDQASQLQNIFPATGGDLVLATYSSGEVTALTLKEGTVLWSDMLAGSAQTALQEERFGILSAIMTPRVSFAGSPKSFTAYITPNGKRIWERRIPLAATPWLSGTTIYMLTTDYQLLAVDGGSGKIIWTNQLPKNNEDKKIIWQHPIVASNAVIMVGNNSELRFYSATDGGPGNIIEIPENITASPIIANGTLYLLGKDATLHALR